MGNGISRRSVYEAITQSVVKGTDDKNYLDVWKLAENLANDTESYGEKDFSSESDIPQLLPAPTVMNVDEDDYKTIVFEEKFKTLVDMLGIKESNHIPFFGFTLKGRNGEKDKYYDGLDVFFSLLKGK